MPLFDRNLVYPSDQTGPYVELEGKVLRIGEPISNSVSVQVETEHGIFTGYTAEGLGFPEVGYLARIRIYDSGGGWYPDDLVVGWRKGVVTDRL